VIPASIVALHSEARGHSSAGRAPALQAGGRRFDPGWLHQRKYLQIGEFWEAGGTRLVLGFGGEYRG
jgi:hypothetical protein